MKILRNIEQPGGGNGPEGKPSIHKLQAHEAYIHQGIDNNLRNSIFDREGKSSLARSWEHVLGMEKIPISLEKRITYATEQIDRTELQDSYKIEQRSEDKETTEGILRAFEALQQDYPKSYREQLLSRVFGYSLASAWNKNKVLEDGAEHISLAKNSITHPFDWKRRQVEQVLSFHDSRNPHRHNHLALATQWGHVGTDVNAITNRMRFIARGLQEYGSMTELRYTEIDNHEKMPIFVPMAIAGGDIRYVTMLVDAIVQDRTKDTIKNPLLFRPLVQIQTQMNLFCQLAEKRRDSHVREVTSNETERQKHIFVASQLDAAVLAYRSMKDIFDEIVSMNKEFLEDYAKINDPIDAAILSGCREVAGEYGISLAPEADPELESK